MHCEISMYRDVSWMYGRLSNIKMFDFWWFIILKMHVPVPIYTGVRYSYIQLILIILYPHPHPHSNISVLPFVRSQVHVFYLNKKFLFTLMHCEISMYRDVSWMYGRLSNIKMFDFWWFIILKMHVPVPIYTGVRYSYIQLILIILYPHPSISRWTRCCWLPIYSKPFSWQILPFTQC